MPPKPKVSKAEKERLKREEEERKAREEEEQRQREEKERLEREEKERLEAEERARLLALEEARFSKEKEIAFSYIEHQNKQLTEWKKECLSRKKWNSYISCATLPDPSDERSLNTFINTYITTPANHVRINQILEGVASCVKLCEELEALLCGDGYPVPPQDIAAWNKEVLHSLPLLVQTKLDQMTLAFLRDAERHTDPDTHNLLVESSIPQLSYCLWGNVIKDPRLKNFAFKERSFVLELPKPLLLLDIALRLVYTCWDTLSPQSRSFLLPSLAPMSHDGTAGTGTPPQASEGAGREGAVDEEREKKVAGTAPGLDSSVQGESGGGRDAAKGDESIAIKRRKKSRPRATSAKRDSSKNHAKNGGGRKKKSHRSASCEVPEASVVATSAVQQQATVPQEAPADAVVNKPTALAGDEVDLRTWRAARGPIVMELLELPALAKVVNNWTIKKVHNELTPFVYPAELRYSHSNQQDGAAPPPLPGSSAWPPIGISMKLPDRFIFARQPQVARWDKESKAWRTSGIQDIVFNMQERQVSLQTFYFAPLALMVDVHQNLPYRSWLLVPKGPGSTHLSIVGAATEVSIEIKGDICCLTQTSEATQLAHLINRPMTARLLMKELREAGANFFPEADAHNYVHDIAKVIDEEQAVYKHMALLASVYGFRHSRWNKLAEKESVILQCCECIHDVRPEQMSWSLCVVGRKRCFKLQMAEESSELSLTMQTGCETHPDLFSTLESSASHEALNGIKGMTPQHIDTVTQWLAATKLLEFS
eukprot:Em0003g289a